MRPAASCSRWRSWRKTCRTDPDDRASRRRNEKGPEERSSGPSSCQAIRLTSCRRSRRPACRRSPSSRRASARRRPEPEQRREPESARAPAWAQRRVRRRPAWERRPVSRPEQPWRRRASSLQVSRRPSAQPWRPGPWPERRSSRPVWQQPWERRLSARQPWRPAWRRPSEQQQASAQRPSPALLQQRVSTRRSTLPPVWAWKRRTPPFSVWRYSTWTVLWPWYPRPLGKSFDCWR